MLNLRCILNLKKILTKSINLCAVNDHTFINISACYGYFHTAIPIRAKVFLDTENDHAYNILQKTQKYNLIDDRSIPKFKENVNIVNVIESRQWLDKPLAEMIQIFGSLAVHCRVKSDCISKNKYDEFVKEFISQCKHINDDELVLILKILGTFPETESIQSHNFLELWTALDKECNRNIPKWNVDNLLYIADHWYKLKLSKAGEFTWQAIRKLSRKITKLTPTQLVQTMFYLNLCRRSITNMIDFEVNLDRCLDKLSIDELAILSMGFFKTKTPIRDKQLLERIYKRFQKEFTTCSDITLVNILKILRYSSKINECHLMKPLLDVIVPEIPRLSLLSCLHIALLGSDNQNCHPGVLEPILKRFQAEIKTARLKDMERISFVMGLYDYENESRDAEKLCLMILEELPLRIDEIAKYPKCLSACLHYLTLKDFASNEMLNTVLSAKFVNFAYGKNYHTLGREIFSLDSYAKINLKDSYTGSYLNDRMIRALAKFTVHYIPDRSNKFKVTQADSLLLEVQEAFEDMHKYATLIHILPHYERPDIIVAHDAGENKFVDMKQIVPTYYSGTIISTDYFAKAIDMKSITLIAIVIGGWNSFVRDTDRPTGIFKMKLRQLELIGYKVVLIPWQEWRSLAFVDRGSYLDTKVMRELKSEKRIVVNKRI